MITVTGWPEERWPDGTLALKSQTFIRHNNKRVDPWFARYTLGQEPARYPMPAIPLAVLHTRNYVLIATPDYWEGELMEFTIVAEFNRVQS